MKTVLAIVTTMLVVTLGSGTAAAAPSSPESGQRSASTVAEPRFRDITFRFQERPGPGYKFFGKVSPVRASRNKQVILLRAECEKCRFVAVRTTRTNNRGLYSFTKLRRNGYFNVKVPRSNGFATSFSRTVWHIEPA